MTALDHIHLRLGNLSAWRVAISMTLTTDTLRAVRCYTGFQWQLMLIVSMISAPAPAAYQDHAHQHAPRCAPSLCNFSANAILSSHPPLFSGMAVSTLQQATTGNLIAQCLHCPCSFRPPPVTVKYCPQSSQIPALVFMPRPPYKSFDASSPTTITIRHARIIGV